MNYDELLIMLCIGYLDFRDTRVTVLGNVTTLSCNLNKKYIVPFGWGHLVSMLQNI